MRPPAALLLLALTVLASAARAEGPGEPQGGTPARLYAADLGLLVGNADQPRAALEARFSVHLGALALSLQGDLGGAPDRRDALALAGAGYVHASGRWRLPVLLLGGVHAVQVTDGGPGAQAAAMPVVALRAGAVRLLGSERAHLTVGLEAALVADLSAPDDQLHGGQLGGTAVHLVLSVGLAIAGAD